MKRAVVTGANGFIGKWLIKELVENAYEVLAVSHKKVSFTEKEVKEIECEIDDLDKLKIYVEYKPDIFFHLAWDGSNGEKKRDELVQVKNVEATLKAVDVAQRMGCKRILCTGTIAERLTDDMDKYSGNRNLIYSMAKSMAKRFFNLRCHEVGIEHIWVQLGGVYGAGNESGNILSYTLNELEHNRVPKFSSALQPIDFIYVKDAVRALRVLSESKIAHEVIYVGTGKPDVLKNYLLRIKNIYGNSCKLKIGSRENDEFVFERDWYATNVLNKEIGFYPAFSFEEGMTETIDYMRKKVKI